MSGPPNSRGFFGRVASVFGGGGAGHHAANTPGPASARHTDMEALVQPQHHVESDADILAKLPDYVYKEGGDPVLQVLSSLPDELDERFLERELAEKDKQLDVINARLLSTVNKSYSAFLKGLSQVQEVQSDLERGTEVLRNGRRYLARAQDDLVNGGLVIAARHKRKQRLMEVCARVTLIKDLKDSEDKMDGLLLAREFPQAIELSKSCRASTSEFGQFKCFKHLNSRILESYDKVKDQIAEAMRGLCRAFDPVVYARVLQAYEMLDNASTVVERLTNGFTRAVKKQTKDVVLLYCKKDERTGAYSSTKFSLVCSQVGREDVLPCQLKIFESLYDVLQIHQQMVRWHTIPESRYPAVQAGLEAMRIHIWDQMQRRVSLFFNAIQLTNFKKIEAFLEIYYSALQFIDIGRRYAGGTEAHGLLTAAVNAKSREFLTCFHRDNIEHMRLLLEMDEWQRVPMQPNFSLDSVKELKRNTFVTVFSPTSSSAPLPMSADKNSNPFRILAMKRFNTTVEEDKQPLQAVAEANEEDNDVDELNQDFIDEDKGRRHSTATATTAAAPRRMSVSRSVAGPIITAASLFVARNLGRYVQVMEVIQAANVEAYNCVTEMFDFYVYVIFRFFSASPAGQKDVLLDPQSRMALPLKNTLLQIWQRRTNLTRSEADHHSRPGDDGGGGARGLELTSVDITSRATLFGLPQRCVAVESMLFLLDVLESVKERMKATLPNKNHEHLQNYFTRSTYLVDNLRTYTYGNIARLLLNSERHVDKIPTAASWDSDDMMSMQHNAYVDSIIHDCEELQQAFQRFDNSQV